MVSLKSFSMKLVISNICFKAKIADTELIKIDKLFDEIKDKCKIKRITL